jgi:hypothetical protein
MNKKDLYSLMEAYDSLATPTGDAAMSSELANTADTETQTSSEGSSFEEKVVAADHNAELFKSTLKEIASLISKGIEMEPWMENGVIKAINHINSATNLITDIREGVKNLVVNKNNN